MITKLIDLNEILRDPRILLDQPASEIRETRVCAHMVAAALDAASATNDATQPAPDRVVREHEVVQRTGLSRTTLWRRVRAGEFPRPREIGPHSKGWLESEVADWLATRH
jgi:prophage regulatory protein